MNKIIIIIICIMIITFNAFAQQPTLLGVHGTSNPTAITNIGAKIARYGFTDYKIKNSIINGDSTAINRMIQLNTAGVKQVIFLRFPEDTIENIGKDYERIPTGIDSIEVFQYLDTFLMSAGPYIDWIQINQEPTGITPYNDSIYSPTQVLNWWRTLATFIKTKINTNPTQLGHLKIITGGIIVTDAALDSSNIKTIATIDSIIKFGEDYCDAIDVHLHTSSLNKGIQKIAYITNRTSHPLATTEWSQAAAAKETGWLTSINTVWTNPSHPFYGLTNFQVIAAAYSNPMSLSAWDSLIATSPYTANFIPDFYAVLDSNCFLFACYAGAFQYGSPNFDWNQLFTNKVTPSVYPNQPFYNEYVNLASLINSGGYLSNCNTVSVKDISKNNQDNVVKIYPNPTNGSLSILLPEIKNSTELYIINALGQKVYSQNYQADAAGTIISIDLNLPSGIYFVALKNNKILSVQKFVLMK